jgi:hypothetical protein
MLLFLTFPKEIVMSWVNQGRQLHGYFGSGTALKVADTQMRGKASWYTDTVMANGQNLIQTL